MLVPGVVAHVSQVTEFVAKQPKPVAEQLDAQKARSPTNAVALQSGNKLTCAIVQLKPELTLHQLAGQEKTPVQPIVDEKPQSEYVVLL